MPYIKANERKKYTKAIEELVDKIESEGQLNYVVTKILYGLVEKWGERYATYNKLVGALECIKQELYRKRISKYEDLKEFENGVI